MYRWYWYWADKWKENEKDYCITKELSTNRINEKEGLLCTLGNYLVIDKSIVQMILILILKRINEKDYCIIKELSSYRINER